jgi:hypothetical protein
LEKNLGNRSVPVLLDSSRHYGDDDWDVDDKWKVVVNIPRRTYTGWLAYGK